MQAELKTHAMAGQFRAGQNWVWQNKLVSAGMTKKILWCCQERQCATKLMLLMGADDSLASST